MVVSEPSNPWVAGESGLFTREFFQDVAHALTPDGVLILWAHTYETDEAVVRLIVRTLRAVFPYATTWLGGPDLVFVASRQALAIDPARIQSRLTPRVLEDLRRINTEDVLLLLSEQAHSNEGQAAFGGAGPVNTDDLNLLEYAAPIGFFLHSPNTHIHDERRSPGGEGKLALAGYLAEHPLTAAQAQRLYEHFKDRGEPGHPLLRASAAAWHRLAPSDPQAAVAEARVSLAQEDAATGVQALEPFISKADPQPSTVALYLRLRAHDAWLRRAPWFHDDLCALGSLEQYVRLHGPADPQITADLAEFDRAAEPSHCVAAPSLPQVP